jgi:hypothetical protein
MRLAPWKIGPRTDTKDDAERQQIVIDVIAGI